ncbi:MAG TPA: cytochrome c3 family protein [Myxococcaceae bacterium]|nr:cytochrome c3 family protein [Myxococcaceae bacterium]
MAWIFKPRANTVARIIAVLLLATPVAVVAFLLIYVRSPLRMQTWRPVPQPIQFDHRHHAGDEAIDCRYCHSTVMVSASAGYPSVATCMNCHSQIWNMSPLLEPVREAYFADRSIPWRRVHNLPDFTYFNHAIHTNKGVGCITCHGRVDLMPSVMKVQPLSMQWCLECHRNPLPHLRPREQVTRMQWEPGAPNVPGEVLADLYDVRPRVECITCHR